MRFRAILNRDGGTLKSTDIDRFSQHITESFEANGHDVDVRPVEGDDLIAALGSESFDPCQLK